MFLVYRVGFSIAVKILTTCEPVYPHVSRLAALFLPAYSSACSKSVSTYSICVCTCYLFFINMLILNLWLTIFQMAIFFFFAVLLKVVTMKVCGFTCGFVRNSMGRLSRSCVFFK